MKKILSYIIPFTKKIRSSINGELEITWINGKKVLDSKNANYSYGALQKLLTYGISKIPFHPEAEILLLGLGGGSIIRPIRKQYQHSGKITAIEIDEVVIQIAKEEFTLAESSSLEIICADAFTYVTNDKNSYDIIIVDLFIDNTVPEQFYTKSFWMQLSKLLKNNAYILFNAGIHLKETSTIETLLSMKDLNIDFTVYDKVQGTNTLLIGKKN